MRLASWIVAASIFCLVTAASSPAQADSHEMAGPAVVQFFQVDVNGSLPAFLDFVKEIRALNQKLGNKGEMRVLQTTIAGDQTNSVFVMVSHANMVALAQAGQRLQSSADFQKLIAANAALGIAAVSNSVAVDITP